PLPSPAPPHDPPPSPTRRSSDLIHRDHRAPLRAEHLQLRTPHGFRRAQAVHEHDRHVHQPPPFFPGTATALTPHSPRPRRPPRGLAGIHHRDRGVIRPPLVMGRRPPHPRLLGARSQTRRSDLQVDAPPRVIVERPPPIRPPRVRAVLIRVQRPHHVDVSRLLIHPGKPLPL